MSNQEISQEKIEELLSKLTLKEKVSLLSGKDQWHTMSIERLGIRSVTMSDGPHGVRTEARDVDIGRPVGPATSFPTGVSMAASWNPALIERVGAALGEETRGMGCDVLLGPCVNIVRTPLAGRNFESYSEDPYLAGRIGVAWVKGLQSKGVGASLKHYACNNQEFERSRGNSVVDERTLREIYLAQFEMIVKEARPWTVMCSYNRINGVYASQNHHLLNEILKGEWGFDGVVVSDWGANHTIFESVQGGLDLEMPGPARYYGSLLVDAVRHWQIDESVIDEAVRRVLRLVARCGKLTDAPAPSGAVNTPEHQALARELAQESITLLKNERGILPLDLTRVKSVALIGPNAAEARIGGGGSSYLEPPYRVSPLEGLRARLGDAVRVEYERGCDNYAELPVIESDWLRPAHGEGHGLWGEYFGNADFSGPAVGELDAKVDFWWLRPPPGVSRDVFSVRWSGELVAKESGRHVLELINSGIARLFLDGQLIVENRPDPSTIEWMVGHAQAHVELVAGRAYRFVLEYVKQAKVEWPTIFLRGAFAPDPDDRIERAVALAKRCDVAIVCAGMPTGYESEGRDRPDMKLPGRQEELIRAVVQANPNTVVVLNCGSPVELPWIDVVPALVLAYYPGQEGGHALAGVLVGDVNPSGKLPVTFPKRYEDNPTFINYPGGREVRYGEGIFVGYRYYDQKGVEPLFPFGFGLSYTTFEYGDLNVPARAKIGEPVNVKVTVKNAGERAGKEVVQLYVGDRQSSLPRPPQELKGFHKVALGPGESAVVEFTLDRRAFAFYDPYKKDWVVEPGEFEIRVGSSSRDIRARATVTLE